MRKFLSKLALFALLFYALNSLFALVLEHRVKLDLWNRHHWLLSKEKETFDVTFVGSSRVMNMIDPDVVSDRADLKCLNLGIGGAGAADNYLLLHTFLQKNRTKTVFLQVDYLIFHNYFSYPFADYIWLCYDNDPVVREVLIQQRGALRYYLWRIVPFLRFIEFSSQYRFFVGQDLPDGSSTPTNGGKHSVDLVGNPPDKTYVKFKLDHESAKAVRNIVELCKENGVRVILFQAPLPNEIEELTDRTVSDKYIAEFASVCDVEYLDFSRAYYDKPEFFVDRHHLNSRGVQAFSEVLGKEVQKYFTR